MNVFKNKKSLKQRHSGFTLVELIVVIALVALFITTSGNLISLSMKAHRQTLDTYTLQSSIRIATDKVTNVVRYSKAVFAVPNNYVSSASKMDSGWYYFSTSPDKKKIIEYHYDVGTGAFKENVLVDEQDGIFYDLNFRKASGETSKLLSFTIAAYYGEVDNFGKITPIGEKITFTSETEGLNTIQVVDKGTYADPSVAIAYKFDDPFADEVTHVGTVTLVLDNSGSMGTALDGGTRLSKLKNALKGDGTKDGLIDILSKETNIEVAMIPFSTNGNTRSYRDSYNDPYKYSNTFYNASTEKSKLLSITDNMTANGGTNTGDGMRRAYYDHTQFIPRDEGYSENTRKVNYMIILVDGFTTYYSKEDGSSQFFLSDGDLTSSNSDLGGNGSTTISNGTGSYVATIGNLIKNASTPIKTYVIGFDSSISTAINELAVSTGTLDSNKHLYNSTSFDLSEVFADIANDIVADMWLVMGPQVQN